MWLGGGVGAGTGEKRILDFARRGKVGELLSNSLITLISQAKKRPGLQSGARTQEHFSLAPRCFLSSFSKPLAKGLEAQVKEP